ncbi:hypothetical protein BDW74DRAFT_38356 [Aspergillus multicolor]|uniref:uncharacterized protein n=1 Tax=Aspergillus multicolor TaxID=41759 RepID=UPI003CCE53CE
MPSGLAKGPRIHPGFRHVMQAFMSSLETCPKSPQCFVHHTPTSPLSNPGNRRSEARQGPSLNCINHSSSANKGRSPREIDPKPGQHGHLHQLPCLASAVRPGHQDEAYHTLVPTFPYNQILSKDLLQWHSISSLTGCRALFTASDTNAPTPSPRMPLVLPHPEIERYHARCAWPVFKLVLYDLPALEYYISRAKWLNKIGDPQRSRTMPLATYRFYDIRAFSGRRLYQVGAACNSLSYGSVSAPMIHAPSCLRPALGLDARDDDPRNLGMEKFAYIRFMFPDQPAMA